MKRITTILTLLMLVCIGAWAETLNLTPASGTYVSSSSNYVNSWSTSGTPAVTITASANNMDKRQTTSFLLWHSGQAGSSTYTITMPSRYLINSYTITATAASADQTLTSGSTTTTFTTSASNTFTVSNLDVQATSFTLTGANSSGLRITSISITYTAYTEVTWAQRLANKALDALANITAYSTAATAAKATVASATTVSEIETAVNSTVGIKVAFQNKLTTTAYLSTTGADISGATFSTDCAWELTSYNTSTGRFKIYNAAHKTYIASLPSADYTAATATTDASSAGEYTLISTKVSDTYYLGFTNASISSNHPALHYQAAGAKCVRWDSDADASMWIVNNVYGVTYNHYKVADADDPSTEDATLLSTTTDYYLSGTEIAYTSPLEALTPVTSLNTTPSDGAISDDVVVNYYYENDATLPFTTSTISDGNFSDPTWYYVTVNDYPVYASSTKMTADSDKGAFHHERWCFVGDAISGVQIYSETTGATAPLNIATIANNGVPTLTASSTNSRWYVSGSTLSNLTFFQNSGGTSYYLNQLGGSDYGSSYSWAIGLFDEGGSTFVLTEANSTSAATYITAAKTAIEATTIYTNAGSNYGWPSSTAVGTLNTAITTATSSTTPTNYLNLCSAWATYQSTTDVTTPSAGFYRFYNATSGCYAKPDGTGNVIAQTTTGTDATTIFYLDESNYLTAYNDGYVVSDCNKTGLMTDAPTAVTFELPATGTYGKLAIKANSSTSSGDRYWYSHLTSESNKKIDKNSDSNTNRCEWTVTSITTLPITANSVGDDYYATLYLPVSVSIPEGTTAYTLTLNDSKTYLIPTAVDGNVPAEQPVILIGEDANVTATIESSAGSKVDTPLSGTLVAKTVTAETDYFLGRYSESGEEEDYEVGFFKWTGTTLKGFRAYLPASEVAAASRGFAIKWNDDEVTGIRTIDNGKQNVKNGAFYDLSGRRVENPQHGMYIVNGRVVVIK